MLSGNIDSNVDPQSPPERIAMLWRLSWNGEHLSCAVYREGERLEMRLESATAVLFAEPFEVRPRMLARVQALRDSLKRRGWEDVPVGSRQPL